MALIDLRAHATHAGISTPAVQAIERHIKEDGQVLVFLNRRGYCTNSALHGLRVGGTVHGM